ncbi:MULTISPECIES: hypothetical protein [unclassified Paenibacillus]|uniref:hypothetical protein n=1 Tax=unclassified Paenibacillus TaxID=185978 RepID=UPI0004F8C18D|nr:hypothetical protein [Paenibacillus sp. FSL H7-0357]AIQ20691.1 hypothetical protein H70357_31415 [Paenibacillus sp. FSL H7-0357]
MVKITGFKELNSRLKEISKGAQELGVQNQMSFEELFPDSFIQKHTPSENISAFLEGVGVKKKEDFEALPQEELESYVRSTTKFTTFHEMSQAALAEVVYKKLGF